MSLFNELKKRNVFRVCAAYLVSAWVILQVADLVLERQMNCVSRDKSYFPLL